MAPLSNQSQLAEVEEALEHEKTKVKQLEGELVTHTMVKEGLGQELEKVCVLEMIGTAERCV